MHFDVILTVMFNCQISPLFCSAALLLCCRSSTLAVSADSWKVYGGVVSQESLPTPYLVKKIILNENYNSQTNDQDIALLKLTRPVEFNGESQLLFIKL